MCPLDAAVNRPVEMNVQILGAEIACINLYIVYMHSIYLEGQANVSSIFTHNIIVSFVISVTPSCDRNNYRMNEPADRAKYQQQDLSSKQCREQFDHSIHYMIACIALSIKAPQKCGNVTRDRPRILRMRISNVFFSKVRKTFFLTVHTKKPHKVGWTRQEPELLNKQ